MAAYDFAKTRLYVDHALHEGASFQTTADQANYLSNVLRMKTGGAILAFNGREGEWRAEILEIGKRALTLGVLERTRAQTFGPDIDFCFAPLKHARLDYMAQKSVEMGAARLRPIITRRTQVARVNSARLRANAIEAAEQCGVLTIPEVLTEARLEDVLAQWPATRLAVFCDEDAPIGDAVATLAPYERGTSCAVLVGPEGGFDPDERAAILRLPKVARLSLGPRILRADTAAVAAMALVQACLGDWR